MQLRVGDKVKFLNEVGEGTVVEVLRNNQVKVETADGFELPCLINDLILIEEEEKKVQIRTNSSSHSNIDDKRLGKVQIPNDSEIIENNNFSGSKDPEGESILLFLALIPENPTHPTDGKMDIFLINDGCYRSQYVVSKIEDNSILLPFGVGMLEPDTKVLLGTISQSDLPHGISMNIQLLFFKNREFKLKQAEQFNISISSIKLLRPGAYTDNDFFNEKVMIIRLTENNSSDFVEPEKIKEAMLTPKLVSDVISSSDKSSNLELEEVDLHIEELIDDSSSLAAKEILDIQLARFTTALEGAINAKTKRMVFIHGVGNGKLKYELRKMLDTKYAKLRYQDASFKEYGYGATLIMLR
jgi:Domain of unknown function (DUF2027)./Smr domain.